MKETIFTPGPWEFNEGMIEFEGDALHAIAMVRGWGWLQKLPNGYEIQCANGKLIAAAPELFEAVEWQNTVIRSLLAGTPIRDADECLAFADKLMKKITS